MNQYLTMLSRLNHFVISILIFCIWQPGFAKQDRMEMLLSHSKASQLSDYDSVDKDLNLYFTHSLQPSDDIATRVIKATDIFLTRPFVFDSVGDGSDGDFDSRPTLATHGFDCMSLSNVVLAMVSSNTVSDFYRNYDSIRYQKFPKSYFSRHHFISFQWHTYNTKHGFITDITRTLQYQNKPVSTRLHSSIDYPGWLQFQKTLLNKKKPLSKSQLSRWQQTYQNSKPVQIDIDYIRFSDFLSNPSTTNALLAQIPSGSIVYFVTPHWDLKKAIGTELDIAHLGFVIVRDKIHYLRHASSSMRAVVEVKLVDYIKEMHEKSKTFQGFTVERINLLHHVR